MPKVSVVIPCYNHGKYVHEAVESVMNQTCQDFEIIIVNDGSTDEYTNNLLKNYEMPKTRIVHTKNQGLASARNNGIKDARGEYILPLDADDRIGKEYLAEAVDILDRNLEIGIVYCEAKFFGEIIGKWDIPAYSIEEMLIDNVIFCSGFFRKKDWEKAGGYEPEMVYGWEDYDFWLSLIETGVLVHRIPKVLFYYREYDSSMVRSKTKDEKVEMFVKIFNKHQSLYKQNLEPWIRKIVDLNNFVHEKDAHIHNIERVMDEKDSHIHNIEAELNLIKQSKVWRIAECFRQLFYIKFLGKTPLLQKGMLTISREGIPGFFAKTKRYLTDNSRTNRRH